MAQRRLFFIFSIVLPFLGISQEDTTSVTRKVIPSIYFDYGKLITLAMDFQTKYEGGIEILINEKFPIILEAGTATLAPKSAYANGSYESTGTYFRIGTGMVSQIYPKNKLGLTLRYAFSSFDESGSYTIESSSGKQADFEQEINRKNVSASWAEAVIYSDRDLNDLITIGMNLRFRILGKYDTFENEVDVFAIPGYGRTIDKVAPAVNLFVKLSF